MPQELMPEEPRLRPAVPADAAALTRLAFASKRHWGYAPELIELWRSGLTIQPEDLETHTGWVAERGDRIAGCVLLSGGTDMAEVEHLWVHPECMGQGIGAALFRAASTHARSMGVRLLRVESDPHAVGFYERMGGRVVEETPSIPAPRMLPVLIFELSGSVQLDRHS